MILPIAPTTMWANADMACLGNGMSADSLPSAQRDNFVCYAD